MLIIGSTLLINRVSKGIKIPTNVDQIICFKVDTDVNLPTKIKVSSVRDYKVLGGWLSDRENEKAIKKMPPKLYTYNGISFDKAMRKLSYWSNSTNAILLTGYENKNKAVSKKEKQKILYQNNVFKAFLKSIYVVLLWKFSKAVTTSFKLEVNTIVFSVASDGDLVLWKELIQLFDPKEITLVILPEVKKIDNQLLSVYTSSKIDVIDLRGVSFRKVIHPRWYFFRQRGMANIQTGWLKEFKIINAYYALGTTLVASGCKALVVNAGENRFQSHILEAIFKHHGKYVFNTMNGIKFNTANNTAVNFTTWFVWDEAMREILTSCEVPLSMMKIKGHLMEDMARGYVFNNTLKHIQDYYDNKKVLFIATSPSAQDERNNLMKSIPAFINKGFYVLWKDHPVIDDDFQYEHDNFEKIGKDFNKETLYDALTVASLVIVSGSTIAIEATWFHVPVLTYEESNESLLYLVKLGTVKQVRSIAELMEAEAAIKYENYNHPPSSTTSIAAAYKQEIMDCINRYG